jgi:hypothetical protein
MSFEESNMMKVTPRTSKNQARKIVALTVLPNANSLLTLGHLTQKE